MKTIVLGADHGGFELKNIIKAHLESKGFHTIDVGTNDAQSCDYPIFASKLCKQGEVGERVLQGLEGGLPVIPLGFTTLAYILAPLVEVKVSS